MDHSKRGRNANSDSVNLETQNGNELTNIDEGGAINDVVNCENDIIDDINLWTNPDEQQLNPDDFSIFSQEVHDDVSFRDGASLFDCVNVFDENSMQGQIFQLNNCHPSSDGQSQLLQGMSSNHVVNQNVFNDNRHDTSLGHAQPDYPIDTGTHHHYKPLRQWIELEKKHENHQPIQFQTATILRKLIIAYGIGKLIQSLNDPDEHLFLDNFLVRESSNTLGITSEAGRVIIGVDMIMPPLSVHLSVAQSSKVTKESMGGIILATVISIDGSDPMLQSTHDNKICEKSLCCAYGKLLHYIFSGEDRRSSTNASEDLNNHISTMHLGEGNSTGEVFVQPFKKKHSNDMSFSEAPALETRNKDVMKKLPNDHMIFLPLEDYGYPPSISKLVSDILSCDDRLFHTDDCFESFKDALDEINFLFQDPRLLFGHQNGTKLSADDKLFGRSLEISQITHAYHRVSTQRKSEAIFISGYSGSGKTKLVQNIIECVTLTSDFVVSRKFEETSTRSSLSVVLSSLDELCIHLTQTKSEEDLNYICQELFVTLGPEAIHYLAGILPSVVLLHANSTLIHSSTGHEIDHNVNFASLCFTLHRFMVVISRYATGLLFFDDLQWADIYALDLVYSVMGINTMENGLTSFLLIGTYRSNELCTHNWVNHFLTNLPKNNIPMTILELDNGIATDDVNLLVSNLLHMTPRLVRNLSEVASLKTRGNPYFVELFMQSLVDKNLLTYSFRVKRWCWDIEKIQAEQITDNVLYLINSKMNLLSSDIQMALKVCSCFGTKIHIDTIMDLSSSQEYSGLLSAMDDSVQEGLFHKSGDFYHFEHDNVRETAYESIEIDKRDRFHFEIGMALYMKWKSRNCDEDNISFIIIDLINYGLPSLPCSPSEKIDIARLNLKAGLTSMKGSDFISALNYLKAAHSVLPTDCWVTQYSLSLEINFKLANAAYPCGEIDLALEVLENIEKYAKNEDKLDANYLYVSISHHHQRDLDRAMSICCKALKVLGEDVPIDKEVSKLTQIGTVISTMLSATFTTDEDLSSMPWTNSKVINDVMKFYTQLLTVVYNKCDGAWLCGYYISHWVRYCLKHKVVCRYTPIALTFYSACMNYEFDQRRCMEGYRYGKMALKLLHESKESIDTVLPRTYLGYYGYIGVLYEPIQACIAQHRYAFQIGMQSSKTCDAIFNVLFMVPRMLESGEKLQVVKKEIEYFQQMAKTHNHSVLSTFMKWYMVTITLLVEDGSTDVTPPPTLEQTSITDSNAIQIIQLIMPACYLGQAERAQFWAKKWHSLKDNEKGRVCMRNILLAFYDGLSCAMIYRRKPMNMLLLKIQKSIAVLTKASNFSEWNFQNKLSLLEAELLSVQRKKEAETNYKNAIRRAQTSKFTHEEALACELAGKHYERNMNKDTARNLYAQAERCYRDWGCGKKADQMCAMIKKIAS